MYLYKLHIQHFRNIHAIELSLSQNCNFFYGLNGSGKTSILEAIYYLNTAKSFRSHLTSRVIEYGQEKFTLFAATRHDQDSTEMALGLERFNSGAVNIHIQGKGIDNITEITKLIPTQVIHQGSFELLDSGPKYKRKFIDWGMFHVEHNFLRVWKNYKRSLDQRNAALKTNSESTIDIWNQELAKWGAELYQWRSDYIKTLIPVINSLLPTFLGNYTISIDYHAGWDTTENLYEVLQRAVKRDKILGFTQYGPHRFDLRILIDNIPIQDVLSRGQQKVFILIMHLAQGMLLKNITNKRCVFLIDDLAAELDETKQHQVAKVLQGIDAQIFITALTPECLCNLQQTFPDNQTFAVKSGEVVLEK